MRLFQRIPFVIASMAIILGVAAPQAEANESRIRSKESSSFIFGIAGQDALFTITGYANDDIVTPFYIGKLRNAPFIRARVRHSGGQTSYRFRVPFNPGWSSQTVQLWRRGSLIDLDFMWAIAY